MYVCMYPLLNGRPSGTGSINVGRVRCMYVMYACMCACMYVCMYLCMYAMNTSSTTCRTYCGFEGKGNPPRDSILREIFCSYNTAVAMTPR